MEINGERIGVELSLCMKEDGCSMVQYDDLQAAAQNGDFDFVLRHADELLMGGSCPPDKVGWIFYYKSHAAMDDGKAVLAIAAGEQALTWAFQVGDSILEGRVRAALGYSLLRLGRVAEAAELLEAYVNGLDQNPGWANMEGHVRFNLAVAYRHSGRVIEAVTQYRKVLALPESTPGYHAQVRQNLAWAFIVLGDAQEAAKQLECVADAVRGDLSLSRLTSFWVDRAALHLLEGNASAARSACHQVLEALDETERSAHLATTYVTLGRIALSEGEQAEAKRCSLLARTHAEKAERWDLHNEATRLWVSASEKGGIVGEENLLSATARLLIVGRRNR